jgi:hypothetical protein
MCEQPTILRTQVTTMCSILTTYLKNFLTAPSKCHSLQLSRRLTTPPKIPTTQLINAKQATTGNNRVGNSVGRNKRMIENGNGNLVRNTSQDDNFEVAAGKIWKNTFSKQLLQDPPTWGDKIKMCTRWHIKGNCYDNCLRAISYVSKENIATEKKSNFLIFMTKCRKAVNKNN